MQSREDALRVALDEQEAINAALLAALEAFRKLRSSVFDTPKDFYQAMLMFELEVVDPAIAKAKGTT